MLKYRFSLQLPVLPIGKKHLLYLQLILFPSVLTSFHMLLLSFAEAFLPYGILLHFLPAPTDIHLVKWLRDLGAGEIIDNKEEQQ